MSYLVSFLYTSTETTMTTKISVITATAATATTNISLESSCRRKKRNANTRHSSIMIYNDKQLVFDIHK